MIHDHVPDLAGQQVRAAAGAAVSEHRPAGTGGQSQIDEAAVSSAVCSCHFLCGEADVVVHEHGSGELFAEHLADPGPYEVERFGDPVAAVEALPAGGVRARQADPDACQRHQVHVVDAQRVHEGDSAAYPGFPAGLPLVAGGAGGDDLARGVREAHGDGGVGELDADVADRTGMDPQHLGRAAATIRRTGTADSDDAVTAQGAEHVGDGGAGQAEVFGDLSPGELMAAMKEGQHRVAMPVLCASLPSHEGRRYLSALFPYRVRQKSI